MEIEKLSIQFHPSGFTEDQLTINNVRIEGLLYLEIIKEINFWIFQVKYRGFEIKSANDN